MRHIKILVGVLFVFISLLPASFASQQTFAQTNDSGGSITTDNATRINKDGNTSSFLLYDNPIFGISVEYPLGWASEDRDFFNQSEPYHIVTEFTYPLESNSDKYEESIVIAIDRYGDFESLNGYLSDLIDAYIGGSSNFRVITNDTNSILAGRPAYKFVFDDLNADGEIRGLEFGTMIDKVVYSISYYAEKDKYYDYLPAFQRMIESFKIFDVGLKPTQAQ